MVIEYRELEFIKTYRAHVRIYTAMSTIGTPAHFGGSLDHDVIDDEVINI